MIRLRAGDINNFSKLSHGDLKGPVTILFEQRVDGTLAELAGTRLGNHRSKAQSHRHPDDVVVSQVRFGQTWSF